MEQLVNYPLPKGIGVLRHYYKNKEKINYRELCRKLSCREFELRKKAVKKITAF